MDGQADTSTKLATPKALLVDAFRRRSALLRIQAFAILGLIVLLLGGAIWIFFSAAEITKQDVGVEKSFRRSTDIEAHIRDLEAKISSEPKFVPSDVESREYLSKVNSIGTKLGELTGRLDELNKEVVNRISNGNAPVDRGSMDLSKALKVSFITYYSALDRDGTDAFIPEYRTDNQVLFASLLSTNAALIGDLNKKFEEILEISKSAAEFRTKVRGDYSKKLAEWQSATQKDRNELNEFRDGLKLVKEQERKQRFGLASTPQEEKNVSIPFLIQTNVTRFGPMLIILFFVNILVNLYRYSIRLAAYYDARGDSLELLDIKIHADAFQKLAASVSPDALDISKPPKLPTEYAVDIAKAAVGKIGASHKE